MNLNAVFFRVFPFCLLMAASSGSIAQHHEIGVGIGGLNYAGDLSRGYNFSSVRPGGQLYYRYNFNPIISLRGFVSGGGLSGSDSNPIDQAAQIRNASFNIGIIEFGGDFEYNFLDIKSSKSLNKWTPYLFLGIGGFFILGDTPVNGAGQYSSFQPMVPVGTGIKVQLTPYLNLDFEVGVRKLFTDWIDDVSNSNLPVKNYRYGNKHDNDWYNYIGLSISYTIYSVDCPYDFYHTSTGK